MRAGASGTFKKIGIENTIVHTPQPTAMRRYAMPSDVSMPNQLKVVSTTTSVSATMPPMYPMPHPSPLTRPTVRGVEICTSIEL